MKFTGTLRVPIIRLVLFGQIVLLNSIKLMNPDYIIIKWQTADHEIAVIKIRKRSAKISW